jgi:hypothetical protein
MNRPPTDTDARESLTAHAASRGHDIREKYGPQFGWPELLDMLNDRACVRYSCEIVFDEAPLSPGEMAHPEPRGDTPEDGFVLYVHPHFRERPADVPPIALYQLVVVNYGPFASSDDAETFGANVLGITRDDYYGMMCALAESVA